MIRPGVTNARPAPRTRERYLERSSLASRAVRGLAGPDRAPIELNAASKAPPASEVKPPGVEYSTRAARITDIDRVMALSGVQPASGDLLRQLVYLPHATVIVAEMRREIV